MNQHHHDDPTNTDARWEEAMSRDFDARVRDLHEAPLDVSDVKGKARRIRRNRRAAVAAGVLGVAAIVTPVAVLAGGNDDAGGREPDFVESPTQAIDEVSTDYIQRFNWHQADGDVIELDHEYYQGVQWGDLLVASRMAGLNYTTEVLDQDGTVVDTLGSTTSPVVINDLGTTIAWVDADGTVMTAWEGGEASLGTVEGAPADQSIPWTVAAITGGPDCDEESDGCVVYLNSNVAAPSRAIGTDGTDTPVAPGDIRVFDATSDGMVSVVNKVDDFGATCGGVYDVETSDYRFETCDYQTQQISPDGGHVAAPQPQYDGLGPSRLSIIDAEDGAEVAVFERDGWLVGDWAWSPGGALVFTAWESQQWHLMAMTVDGEITEIADPVAGDDYATGFRPVRY